MLDDFREQAGDGGLLDDNESIDFDDYEDVEEEEEIVDEKPIVLKDNKPKGPFLGITAPQRLFISFMLLVLSCVLSTMCLVLAGRMMPF